MALLASNISPGLVSLCAVWCGRAMCLGDAMKVMSMGCQWPAGLSGASSRYRYLGPN